MATNKPMTELDFDQIKSSIITFIQSNPTFTDYNFEGSALNAIVDILAYNTHNSAYYANMLHNESFLDTAQKRASVVSRAKELGYTPKSVGCSTAYIDINVLGVAADVNQLYIGRGTSFYTTNDSGTYKFINTENLVSTFSDNIHTFKNVKIVNGTLINNKFTVDIISNVRSIFNIPNKNIDISTIKVFVRENAGAVNTIEYFNSKSIYELRADSRSFFIQESYDGFYQIYFGEDVLGVQPINGNIIDIEYAISTQYDMADNCSGFSYAGTALGSGISYNIVTTQKSFGGSYKEDIDSIRYNAVKSNTAKMRIVTASDYEIYLKANFNYIKSVSVWGGETMSPPVYGKVYISIAPMSGYILADSTKTNIIYPAIKSASVMTVIPEFIDPDYICVEFFTKIKFNPNKTVTKQFSIENTTKALISDYVAKLSSFNMDYLESKLVNDLLNTDPGIVTVNIEKLVGFKISPIANTDSVYTKQVLNSIKQGTVSSTKFNVYYDTLQEVSIKEIIGKTATKQSTSGLLDTLQYLGLYNSSGNLIKEIGYYNTNTGEFSLSLKIYSYITSSNFISINFALVNTDITVSKNKIIILDTVKTDTRIGYFDNNKVLTEIYGK